MPAKLKLEGNKFGKLTAIRELDTRICGKVIWLCICECGNETQSTGSNLSQGLSKSCGKCKGTHHMYSTRFYATWTSMLHRCRNPNSPSWKDYGGRGIKVCEEWGKFENFYKDMFDSYSKGLSLDRINNDLGYFKGNCRWTTLNVQIRNRRKPKTNTLSIYRNVTFDKRSCRFVARMCNAEGKLVSLGSYIKEEDAAKAVDKFIIDNNLPNILNFKKEEYGIQNND